MATTDKNANRKRPDHIRVMVAESEKQELQLAANEAGMALSVFMRVMALEAAKRRREKAA